MPRETTTNQPSLEAHFRTLVKRWKKDTEVDSSITRMVRHPAYQEIIGMGQPRFLFSSPNSSRNRIFGLSP